MGGALDAIRTKIEMFARMEREGTEGMGEKETSGGLKNKFAYKG